MSGIRVARVYPAGWATLRQVRLAALAESPAAFASTLERERRLDEAEWRRRAGRVWFLAWDGEEPVGIVSTGALTGPEDGDPRSAWGLYAMWVAPAFRGRGAGDRLVASVLKHARAQGAARVTLWVADGNARARAFYLRMGFRPTGARQTYRRDDGTELNEDELSLELR